MDISALFQQIIDNPGPSLLVISNLIIIESLLSVDNAAVLATMVMDLPKEQRNKALKYGIIGAYVFRGLALVFAAFLVQFWYLKPIGGLYLLYLVWDWWKGKQTEDKEDDFIDKKGNWLYRITVGSLGNFWATVALVELMDMAFSIDNVFAAVAFSKNILIIWIGVFIGILAMRFVAQSFVKLMEKYPFLETCAFIVIAILGLKLLLSVYTHYYPCSDFSIFMEGNHGCLQANNLPVPEGHAMVWGDLITSFITVGVFFLPILYFKVFKKPKAE
ncbi:MAG: TerC family protein [Bacteroidetes bacterium]|nr:TerC family protein [Bacteroidota bacterium]